MNSISNLIRNDFDLCLSPLLPARQCQSPSLIVIRKLTDSIHADQ